MASIFDDPQVPLVSGIFSDVDQPAFSMKAAMLMAQKAAFAEDREVDPADVEDFELTGGKNVRTRMAADQDLKDFHTRTQMVKDSPDAATVTAVTTSPKRNPDTILEDRTADRAARGILRSLNPELVNNVPEDEVVEKFDFAKEILKRQQIAHNIAEKYRKIVEDQDTLPFIADFTKSFIPTYDWLKNRNLITSTPSFLPGNNKEEQINHLYSLPPAEFKRQLDIALEELAADNPQAALAFANAVVSYSASDQMLDNVFGLLEGAEIGVFAKAFGKGMKAYVKTTAKNADKGDVDAIVEDVGNTKIAAETAVDKKLTGDSKIADDLPSLLNTEAAIKELVEPTHMTGGAKRKFVHAFNKIMDGPSPARLDNPASVKAAKAAAWKEMKLLYRSIDDGHLDTTIIPPERTATNTYRAEYTFGDPKTAGGFDTEVKATRFKNLVYKFPKDEAEVVPHGDRFVIKVSKDLAEEIDEVKNVPLKTENMTPVSVFNRFLPYLRSAEDQISPATAGAAKVVQSRASVLEKTLQDVVKPTVGKLSKKSEDNLVSFMDHYKNIRMPGQTELGHYFTNKADLKKAWKDFHGKAATDLEVDSYFDMVTLNNLDFVFKNITLMRHKIIRGIQRMTIPFRGESGELIEWDGKLLKALPDDDSAAGVMITDAKKGTQVYTRKNMPEDTLKEVRDGIKAGRLKIVQVSDPLARPLADFAGNRNEINFVITPRILAKRQPYTQIPYKPGGHIIFRDEHYMKQGKIRTTVSGKHFEGDNTIMNFGTGAEASRATKAFNKAREMILDGADDTKLKAFLDEHLPLTPDEFRAYFEDFLDVNEPVYHITKDETTYSRLNPENVMDRSKSKYNMARQIESRFTQDRDTMVKSIDTRRGSDGQPLYEMSAPRFLDTYRTTNEAMRDMTRNLLFDDYKVKSVNDLIEQFNEVIDVPLSKLRNDPQAFFRNPKWKNNHLDRTKLAAAKGAHAKIKQFIGEPSATQQAVHDAKAAVIEKMFKLGGTDLANMASDFLLDKNMSPTTTLRAMAFNSKLGLFNPVQLWLQGQAFVHGIAISPKHGVKGASDAVLMATLRLSPDMAEVAAKKAGYTGTDLTDFLERWKNLQDSGWMNIGGEVANLDDVFRSTIVQGRVDKFFDAGRWFFNSGERFARMTAYNTAHREWKALNPGKLVDNVARRQILQRADLMTVNMTRASNASWQSGFASIPTQFWTFHARLTEQMLGKRLTWAEKARIMAMYSTIYGVPTGVLGTTTGAIWPATESIKAGLDKAGIKYNDSFVGKALTDGLLDAIVSATAGDFNITERYGPTGMGQIRDILYGDMSAVEAIIGASGNIFGDFYKNSVPLLWGIGAAFGDRDDSPWSLTVDDVLDAARGISTMNNIHRGITILETGYYISRNENKITSATTADAVASFIFGLTPQPGSDAFRKAGILKERRDAIKDAEKEVIKNYRRGFRANSREERDAFFKRALAISKARGMRADEHARAWNRANKGYETAVQSIDRQWQRDYPEHTNPVRER